MFKFRYLQTSLILTALQIAMCGAAHAGESQASSEASVSPNTSAEVTAGSQSSRSGASESARSSGTEASTTAASESRAPASRPIITTRQQNLQQVVNEVSKPQTARTVPVHTRKSTAHWKTRYWNQKTASKKATH